MTISNKAWSLHPCGDQPYYDTRYDLGDRPLGSGGSSGAAAGGTAALSWVAPQGLASGNALIISTDGTHNFGTKLGGAKPEYLLAPGETGVWGTHPTLSRKTLAPGATEITRANQSIVTDVTAPGSNYAMRHLLVPSGPGHKVQSEDMGGPFITDADGGGGIITIFAKRRLNFSGPEAYAMAQAYSALDPSGNYTLTPYNFKWWRWWMYPNVNGPWRSQPDFVVTNTIRNDVVHTAHFTEMDGESVNRNVWEYPSVQNPENYGYNKNVWTTELLQVKQSSAPGVADGWVRYRANGSLWNVENTITQSANRPGTMSQLFLPQPEHIYTTATDWATWLDIVSMDDSGMCVVLTDRPTWDDQTTTVLELQPSTAWAQLGLSVSLRQGGLASIAGSYLYILVNGVCLSNAGVQL